MSHGRKKNTYHGKQGIAHLPPEQAEPEAILVDLPMNRVPGMSVVMVAASGNLNSVFDQPYSTSWRPKMRLCRNESLSSVFVLRMIGIITFLIVVVLANILTHYVSNPIYRAGVFFLNENFWLLLLIAIILLVGDIFFAFPFPLNLPAPIIRAIGSVFVIAFMLHIFQWVDSVAATSLYSFVWVLSFVIVPVVFIVVLVSGYFEIMRKLFRAPQNDQDSDNPVVHDTKSSSPDETISDAKSWEEIGDEFRLAIYDLMHRFRQEIRKK